MTPTGGRSRRFSRSAGVRKFWRPIGAGVEPLADGVSAGMELRGYGNAIVPQLAAEFIAAYMETTNDGGDA